MEQLLNKLRENNLVDEYGAIILERNEAQTITVDLETFQTFFGDKSFTYTNLSGSHTFVWGGEQITKTANQLGYKKYFDLWKSMGIL